MSTAVVHIETGIFPASKLSKTNPNRRKYEMAHRNRNSSTTIAFQPIAVRPHIAAEMCGCSPSFIEDECRDGNLQFKVLGDGRSIPIKELKKWYDSLPVQTGKLAARGRWAGEAT